MEPEWRLRKYVHEMSDDNLSTLRLFHVELLRENQVLGLIKPGTERNIDILLFYDAILVSQFIKIDAQPKKIYQVGASHSVLGIVFAALFPEIPVLLSNEDERRCRFFSHIAERTGLKNIEVVNESSQKMELKERGVCLFQETTSLARNLLLGSKIMVEGDRSYTSKGPEWFSEVATLPSQICSTWNTEMALEYELPERLGSRVILRSVKIG